MNNRWLAGTHLHGDNLNNIPTVCGMFDVEALAVTNVSVLATAFSNLRKPTLVEGLLQTLRKRRVRYS